jgi:hypothetical protein
MKEDEMGKSSSTYSRDCSGDVKGRDYLTDLGVHSRLLLRWIVRKEEVKVWKEFVLHRIAAPS